MARLVPVLSGTVRWPRLAVALAASSVLGCVEKLPESAFGLIDSSMAEETNSSVDSFSSDASVGDTIEEVDTGRAQTAEDAKPEAGQADVPGSDAFDVEDDLDHKDGVIDSVTPDETAESDAATLDVVDSPETSVTECKVADDCVSTLPPGSLGLCQKADCLGGVCGKGDVESGPCEDGNICTVGDHCVFGSCVAGDGQKDCDDQNPCTVDTCDSSSGCKSTQAPDETACANGTTPSWCKQGACIPKLSQICVDGTSKCSSATTLETCTGGGTSWKTDDCSAQSTGCDIGVCAVDKCVKTPSVGKALMSHAPLRAVPLADGTIVWLNTSEFIRTDGSGKQLSKGSLADAYPANIEAFRPTDIGLYYLTKENLRLVDYDGNLKSYQPIPKPCGGCSGFTKAALRLPNGDIYGLGHYGAGTSGPYSGMIFRATKSGVVMKNTLLNFIPQEVPFMDWNDTKAELLVVALKGVNGNLPGYPYLLRVDGSGKLDLQIALKIGDLGLSKGVVQRLAGGDFIIGGRNHIPDPPYSSKTDDLAIGRANQEGKLLWWKRFGSGATTKDYLAGIWVSDALLFVVLMSPQPVPGAEESWRLYRMALDGTGFGSHLHIWQSTAEFYQAGAAAPAPHGALIAAYKAGGPTDLFQIDNWGNSTCAEASGCISLPAAACGTNKWCTGGVCK